MSTINLLTCITDINEIISIEEYDKTIHQNKIFCKFCKGELIAKKR